jgi:hypothetical protein
VGYIICLVIRDIDLEIRRRNKFSNVEHKYTGKIVSGNRILKMLPRTFWLYHFRFDFLTGKVFRIRNLYGDILSVEKEITNNDSKGYLRISVTDKYGRKKKYLLHRVIYFVYYGIDPKDIVDHRDGDTINNRPDNLRIVSSTVNQRNQKMQSNNTSGFTGVYWNTSRNKWIAQISINGKMKYLGSFDSIEEAKISRESAIETFNIENPKVAFTSRHGLVS